MSEPILVQQVAKSAQINISAMPKSDGLRDTYYTHDNGGRPFKVVLGLEQVDIHKMDLSALELYDEKVAGGPKGAACPLYESEPNHSFQAQRVFIGKSPLNSMTEFSGGSGPEFDGNSLLLQVGDLEYVYVGERILKFTSKSPICEYISPVGNNDVPYPYAVDCDGRHYLLIVDVVLEHWTPSQEHDDPYNYYYENSNVIAKKGQIWRIRQDHTFDDITSVYDSETGGEPVVINYIPNQADFGYKSLLEYLKYRDGDCSDSSSPTRKYQLWVGERHLPKCRSKAAFPHSPLTVPDTEKHRYELTETMYIDMMQRFSEKMGFSRLEYEVIEART